MTEQSKELYLISDSDGQALGMGRLVTPPDAKEMQLLVLDYGIDEVEGCDQLLLTGMRSGYPGIICKLLRCRGDKAFLTQIGSQPPDSRRNLRVPLEFDTYVYPLTGRWRGRMAGRLQDLSCGGVAFFCGDPLEIDEWVEIAVPALEGLLLLKAQILRRRDPENGEWFHAAKFVDMCEDEEVLAREMVFNIQLTNHSRKGRSNH